MTGEFKIDSVLPWGRTVAEYRAFFGLTDLSRETRLLDCAAGPASFNATMTRQGYSVVSADPLYQVSGATIAARVEATRGVVLAGLRAAKARFNWSLYESPEALEAVRLGACRSFLGDYDRGRGEGRYLAAGLPALPFAESHFDLALCSHFLFLYGGQFDLAFHETAIREMLRVAAEVRIFPLLDLDGQPSPLLAPLRARLGAQGCHCRVERVPYEFQIGGHSMLRVRAACRGPSPDFSP